MAGAKGKSGGSRAGSGRRSTQEKYRTPINQAEKRFADRLPELSEKMLDLAMGALFVQKDADGNPVVKADGSPVVYLAAPELKALVYCIDRIMGKPTQPQDLTSSDGSVGGVTIFIPANGRDAGDTTAARTADDVSEQPG